MKFDEHKYLESLDLTYDEISSKAVKTSKTIATITLIVSLSLTFILLVVALSDNNYVYMVIGLILGILGVVLNYLIKLIGVHVCIGCKYKADMYRMSYYINSRNTQNTSINKPQAVASKPQVVKREEEKKIEVVKPAEDSSININKVDIDDMKILNNLICLEDKVFDLKLITNIKLKDTSIILEIDNELYKIECHRDSTVDSIYNQLKNAKR